MDEIEDVWSLKYEEPAFQYGPDFYEIQEPKFDGQFYANEDELKYDYEDIFYESFNKLFGIRPPFLPTPS